MKKISFYFAILMLSLVFVLVSCNKKEEPTPANSEEKGTLQVEFDNFAGNSDLVLGTSYNNTNTQGEQLTPDLLQYFISNVRLKKTDGSVYVIPQDSSYFLIKESDVSTQTINLRNIPAGDYNEITFTIGIDSLRSTMPADRRTGALDVTGAAQGMYWSWNSGYIFVKFEGTSPQAVTTNNTTGRFKYHIGGFGGYSSAATNNIRTKTISFGNNKATVRSNKTPKVHLTVDVLKFLNGTTNVSLRNNPTVMSGAMSTNIANNIPAAFEFDHVHN
jgi:hypothetical protein